MAKKQRRKNIGRLDNWVVYGYKCGVWQSAIGHTILLLILSLITITDNIIKPIKISLSFSSNQDIESVYLDRPDDPIEIIEEKTGLVEEHENIDVQKITSTSLVTINPDPEPEIINNTPEPEINEKDLISFVGVDKKNDDFIETNSSDSVNSIVDNIKTSINTSAAINTNGFGGAGDEFSRRLSVAGAKSGDVQISIMWNTTDDIDLHVSYTPGNGLVDNINWTSRIGRLSSGMLDIDRNANSAMLTNAPVENVFWPKGHAPNGFFVVYIHFFRSWTGQNKVPIIARLKIGNKFEEIKCMAILYQSPQEISRFKFEN